MKINKQTKLVLAHAILWAWLMLCIAYFSSAVESNNTIILFLVAGWFISLSILISSIRSSSDDSYTNGNARECFNQFDKSTKSPLNSNKS